MYASIVKDYIESKGIVATVVENGRNNAANVGISVRKDNTISPIFYIQDDVDEDPFEFAEKILSFEPESIDTERLSEIMTDREEVLKRARYILVNSSLNEKRDSIVRVPINSTLELHYKLEIGDILKDGKVCIEKKHLENLNIPLHELAHRAYINTMEHYPAEIYSLSELLSGIDSGYLFKEFMVLSNKSKIFGAGAILYEGMYEKLQEVMEGDFVVIPSSVHEVILVKTEYGDIDALTNIIASVNESVVTPEEVLSDRPYKLIRDKKLVEA